MENTTSVAQEMKQAFQTVYKTYITRPGADKLLEWLETKSDFFTAPASTKYHCSYEGGLCEHSLNVYERLKKLCDMQNSNAVGNETIAIVSLLHDVCKTGYYTKEMRNVKENGIWVQKPFYAVEDKVPFGHGEKSVYIISSFMKLTREEAMAIRWHMGGFDDSVKGGSRALGEAWNQYSLGVLLHCADLQATYIDEGGK